MSIMENKIIKLPSESLKRSIELYFDERPYEIKKVSIKKLVDDNHLLDDNDLESYHQKQWENKPAKDFSINIDKLNNMRASEIPYASERDGKLILGDGRHRVRAAYNDGYEYIELPVIKESLNEVYPNKGESKKDFIKRFMSVTKKEYPDKKQRFAVANSYWERRHKINEDKSKVDSTKPTKITAYHSSPNKFTRFDIAKFNSGTGDNGMYGKGFYFTESSELAKA